tara:strand:- start:3021 stop:3248 length:228 start_codon:yes stop_codon:yes gene_type:complete
MAVYAILTEEELKSLTNSEIFDFICNNYKAHSDSPKRQMLVFEDSLPSSLSSYNPYTETEVQAMFADPNDQWFYT